MAEEKKVDPEKQNEEIIDQQSVTNAENNKKDETLKDKGKDKKTVFNKSRIVSKKYEEKIADLENRLNELNDNYLRLFSEFDNYRKRTNRERLDLLKSASEETIIGLLPVLDDFERAIAAVEKNGITGIDADGIKLIYNKLLNILKKKGLEPLQAEGEVFNTDFHEALTTVPAPDDDMKGKVIEEVEKGYLLNGKVIRFARVIVGQ
ncbi:MAG TPA: nucleotide exchange factor GrpE [Bacteroidales bacterium]|nr:nucleotide exchange factor GrpE [Bacteroidales bacterium]HPR57609.1 nucleotide exchange factor GrpE [Bacteroidales bacterium]HRW97193.1 nucleotide exchange factor GrpE [Bacteroidales bacterium]